MSTTDNEPPSKKAKRDNKDAKPNKAGANNNNNKNNPQKNNAKKQARLCPGRDVYERMNFLYQASMLMAETSPALSAGYGKLMKSVGKKAVLRIEPAIKRTLCARCGVALNPASTADYSDFRQGKVSYIEVKCCHCGYSKRYYNAKNHKIRLDDPASVIETMVFERE